MIKGLDFYNLVLDFSKAFKNVIFKYENLKQIWIEKDIAFVETKIGRYAGEYVFNSTTLFNPEITTQNSLSKYFEDWVIRTKKLALNAEIVTLRDFNLYQECRITFIYVIFWLRQEKCL